MRSAPTQPQSALPPGQGETSAAYRRHPLQWRTGWPTAPQTPKDHSNWCQAGWLPAKTLSTAVSCPAPAKSQIPSPWQRPAPLPQPRPAGLGPWPAPDRRADRLDSGARRWSRKRCLPPAPPDPALFPSPFPHRAKVRANPYRVRPHLAQAHLELPPDRAERGRRPAPPVPNQSCPEPPRGAPRLAPRRGPTRGTPAPPQSDAPPDCHYRRTRHRLVPAPANHGCHASCKDARDGAASVAWFAGCLSSAAKPPSARSTPCRGRRRLITGKARCWWARSGWQ